jgi:transcriptional regulator with XRE-family HTH domain
MFGHHMQQIRRSRNLTQEQVAELIGMDRVSIGYIEQGRRAPKLSTLFSLANVYDVEMQDFFSLPTKSQDDTHE